MRAGCPSCYFGICGRTRTQRRQVKLQVEDVPKRCTNLVCRPSKNIPNQPIQCNASCGHANIVYRSRVSQLGTGRSDKESCGDDISRQAVSSVMQSLGCGSVRVDVGGECETHQHVEQNESQRTYGFPVMERTSTRLSKDTYVSDSTASHHSSYVGARDVARLIVRTGKTSYLGEPY